MKPAWLDDARLIPDEVMSYVRMIAVHAVRENGFSPEDVSELLGISRSSVYVWLKCFKHEGYEGLETKKAPGAEPVVTATMDAWLKQTVLETTPRPLATTRLCGPVPCSPRCWPNASASRSAAPRSMLTCTAWD